MISKERIRQMLDIADLKTSARLMLLVVEIVELQADLKALESLVQMQYDSHAVDAAKNHVRQQHEYMEINNELKKATEAVAKAMSDPEARLRAMLNAKLRGDMQKEAGGRNMEKTTVIRLQCFICDELVSEYKCSECNAEFIDRYEEYGYCPYCGREIVYVKEQKK